MLKKCYVTPKNRTFQPSGEAEFVFGSPAGRILAEVYSILTERFMV
jgi:hypothetical protein